MFQDGLEAAVILLYLPADADGHGPSKPRSWSKAVTR